MVPISHKLPTTRSATAKCTLHFSNPTTLPLIRSNAMKKGDVLSMARIAGIMAAKQTSGLIPLCHPIAITSVGVDLEVVDGPKEEVREVDQGKKTESVPWQGTGQGGAYPFHVPSPFAPQNNQNLKARTQLVSSSTPSDLPAPVMPEVRARKGEEGSIDFGRIEISATVDCDGKTGVEMEALTAASVAALTVYDMCKSVDKSMRIEGLRVTRKEGGKSGTWVEGERVE